jgi:uracil-DNA glycosylase
MTVNIHPSWYAALAWEFKKPYWAELTDFVKREYSQKICFPEGKNIFRAFDTIHFEKVKVVILGQDPYHTAGAAMWLSFSVPNGSKAQPSLRNIFKELESDLWVQRTHTDLTDWAEQWVLLLNAVLTVREWEPASHQKMGWENFTDATIRTLSEKREWIVFILWGNYAIAKKSLIDKTKHHIITSPHPSPFSAYNWFFGSRPFSRANTYLREQGSTEIVWG